MTYREPPTPETHDFTDPRNWMGGGHRPIEWAPGQIATVYDLCLEKQDLRAKCELDWPVLKLSGVDPKTSVNWKNLEHVSTVLHMLVGENRARLYCVQGGRT